MITTHSIRRIKYRDYHYDEIWLITQTQKYPNPHIKHVPVLAPPQRLFYDYLDWRRKSDWGPDKFRSDYVPRYLQYLHDNKQANELLGFLAKTSEDICLVCYCPNESMCHRSIVAGLLQGFGQQVTTENDMDYSTYFQQYRQSTIGVKKL